MGLFMRYWNYDGYKGPTNLVRNIIDNNDPVSSSVVTGRNGAESLLSSGVPLWTWKILLQFIDTHFLYYILKR